MKRVTFATPEVLREHCLRENLSLIVEYRDEENRQRQVVLEGERLNELETYINRPKAVAYFRSAGIFHEVVAGWR
jgi:hypothetical protein